MAVSVLLRRMALAFALFAAGAGATAADDDQTVSQNPAMSGAPAAQGCHLYRVTQMDLTTERDGLVSVPATVNGQTIQMLVDTGGGVSLVADTLAIRQRLRGYKLSRGGFELMGGVRMDTLALVDQFRLGDMPASPVMFLVAPWNTMNTDISGVLAPDIMAHYEVEIDFAAARLALYTQQHCAGQVVYWTKEPFARVPFQIDRLHHMLINVLLDGKPVLAAIDTGADRTSMTLDAFEDIFGLRKSDPNLKVVTSHASINGTAETSIYTYPFKTLVLDGVTVTSPSVDIIEGDRFDPDGPKIVIGVQTLRQLHMFIAYDEQTLYLTPAEAR